MEMRIDELSYVCERFFKLAQRHSQIELPVAVYLVAMEIDREHKTIDWTFQFHHSFQNWFIVD
jgi:hypothetical protein